MVEQHGGHWLRPMSPRGGDFPYCPRGVWVGLSPQGRGLLPPLAQQLRWQRVRKEDLNPSESMFLRCGTKLELPKRLFLFLLLGHETRAAGGCFCHCLEQACLKISQQGKAEQEMKRQTTVDIVRAAGYGQCLKQYPRLFSIMWINNFLFLLKPAWLGFRSLVTEISPD